MLFDVYDTISKRIYHLLMWVFLNHIKVQSKEENLLKNIINRYLLSNMKKEKDLDSEILPWKMLSLLQIYKLCDNECGW